MKRLPILSEARYKKCFSFSAFGTRNPAMNKTSRHIQWEIQKMRRTSITDHAGVLMGSTGPRSGGYSGCATWKKPRPNTWKH
jgi:hypothetical protein